MSFLYPNFLWAIFAIFIPIIIHLFNLRTHKVVYFSNISFLQNIEQESKSRNRIKDLLILLFRILTILSLVLAFANPVKYNSDVKNNNLKNLNCLYIDNSFSMNALNKDGSSIEVAKSRANDIISSFKTNSKSLLITNNLSSDEQHFYISEIIKDNISKISVSPVSRTTDFIVHKINNIVLENSTKESKPDIYLISDFQRNIFDPKNIDFDTSYNVYLIPIAPNSPDNLYIDSVWFESPFHLYKAQDSVIVRIVNQSNNEMINQQIKLFINDTLKTMSTFRVGAHSSEELKIVFNNNSSGNISGRLEIEDYPVIYDNKLYFDYYISPRKNVLLIKSEKQEEIEKFYSDDNYFNFSVCNFSQIPISELNTYNTIILNFKDNLSTGLIEKLFDFVQNDGVLVFLPTKDLNLSEANKFFEKFGLPEYSSLDTHKYYCNRIDLQDKIYKNAFKEIKPNSVFPYVKSHFKSNLNKSFELNNIVTLENDDVFLYYKNIGSGSVYVFTSSLSETNSDFMFSPLSVPTFYNIPIFSSNIKIPYYIIGQSKLVQLQNLRINESIKLRNSNTEFEFFPQIRKINPSNIKISFGDFILEAGNYKILDDEKELGLISLNYSRKESDLQYYTLSELEELLNKSDLKRWNIYSSKGLNLQNEIKFKDNGKYYWKLFIILALFFILAEILTIKFFKN